MKHPSGPTVQSASTQAAGAVTPKAPRPPRRTASRRGARLGPLETFRFGWEYRQHYDNATAMHGRAFVLFVRREAGLARRAGFVAGKRVGDAVRRNRARRVLREVYRKLKQDLPALGFQVVFVARAPCPGRPIAELDQEMRRFLQRAGLL